MSDKFCFFIKLIKDFQLGSSAIFQKTFYLIFIHLAIATAHQVTLEHFSISSSKFK